MFQRTKLCSGLLAAFGTDAGASPSMRAARRALRRSVPALAGALIGVSAFAQSAPATGTPPSEAPQRVEITGSMLTRSNAETAEAITVISSASLKAQGVTTIEQALQSLSANQTNQVTATSVGTYDGGSSLAGLRGLDAGKTLVLLDGQRLANNVYSGDAVDLNLIPFAAIDRIEVLREGASSIYGADAIAGVINFITKKDYRGGELDLAASRSQGHGGNTHSVSLTYGKGSLTEDGYNVMAAANFNNTGELRGYERAYASGYNPAIGLAISNSPGTWPGNFVDANGNSFQVNGAGCPGNPFPSTYLGKCDYLYAEAVDLIPKSSQYSGLLSVSKSLPGNNVLSAQYFIAKSKITTWGGPMFYEFAMSPTQDPTYFPTAANSTEIGGGNDAPDLAHDITAIWTDPLNDRYNSFDNTEQRALLTLTGEASGWNYGVNASYSSNKNLQSGTGYPDETILSTADGNYLNDLVNPFGPQSAAGQALINSSYKPGLWAVGKLSTWDVNAQLSHELADYFNAGEAASVAVGIDARGERISYKTTDLADVLSGVTGFPPTSVVGSRNAQAVYAELSLPVTRQLQLTLSDREDRYSDFGNTNNGKLAFRFQPSESVTLRGAASTGFRAPTLVNLFSPTTLGAAAGLMNGPGCTSPTGSTYPTIFTPTVCNSQGLVLSGGNRNLKPELSKNLDLGIVLAPVKDLGITLDWYRIIVSKDISTVPTSEIYAHPDQFKSLYHLNSAGSLTPSIAQANDCPTPDAATCGYIETNLANVGGRETTGFDLSTSYLLRTGNGNFRFGLEGTLVTQFRRQSYTGAPWVSVLGKYNGTNQVVVPWQSNLSVDWSQDIWAAGITQHFDAQYQDQQPLSDGTTTRYVKPQSIYNVYASVKPIAHVTVLLGVHNLFNRNPPQTNQYVSNFQLGYNPLLADPTGRAIYATLKAEF